MKCFYCLVILSAATACAPGARVPVVATGVSSGHAPAIEQGDVASTIGDGRVSIRWTGLSSALGDDTVTSREGREILLYSVDSPGDRRSSRRIYLQAGLHGNEAAGPEFLAWELRRLAEGRGELARVTRRARLGVDLVPVLNPDGYLQGKRENAQRADLNRNFPVLWQDAGHSAGGEPGGEPETRAALRLLSGANYMAAVDVHGYIDWVVLPTRPIPSPGRELDTTKRRMWPPRPGREVAWSTLQSGTHEALRRSGLSRKVMTAGDLGHGGAFEDSAFWQFGIPSVCLEIASKELGVDDSGAPTRGDARLAFPGGVLASESVRAVSGQREAAFEAYETFIARLIEEIDAEDGASDAMGDMP